VLECNIILEKLCIKIGFLVEDLWHAMLFLTILWKRT